MLFNATMIQVLLYGLKVWGGTISVSTWTEIEKIQKLFVRKLLGVKSSTFYLIILLETYAQPIEVLTIQSADKYITKVKNMLKHKLPKQAWNI